MRFLLRVLVSAAALGVATWAVSGITLPAAGGLVQGRHATRGGPDLRIINATLKPLIRSSLRVLRAHARPVALVVNGLLPKIRATTSSVPTLTSRRRRQRNSGHRPGGDAQGGSGDEAPGAGISWSRYYVSYRAEAPTLSPRKRRR